MCVFCCSFLFPCAIGCSLCLYIISSSYCCQLLIEITFKIKNYTFCTTYCVLSKYIPFIFLRTRLLMLQSVLFFVKLCQCSIYILYISCYFLPLIASKTAYQRNSFMQFIVKQFSKCSHLFFLTPIQTKLLRFFAQ